MTRPIQVGDLVQCIRPWPCCGFTKGIGLVSLVEEIAPHEGCCWKCGTVSNQPAARFNNGLDQCLLIRLKRIPPPEELEGEKTQEDLREPA